MITLPVVDDISIFGVYRVIPWSLLNLKQLLAGESDPEAPRVLIHVTKLLIEGMKVKYLLIPASPEMKCSLPSSFNLEPVMTNKEKIQFLGVRIERLRVNHERGSWEAVATIEIHRKGTSHAVFEGLGIPYGSWE